MILCNKRSGVVLVLAIVTLVSGCAGLVEGKKARQTSSVVDYLYPNKSDATDKPSVPKLTLPINVGIAFVPTTSNRYSKHELDATLKRQLMERISDKFRQYKFIKNIEIIPTPYLNPGGSFDNLDQIKTMYGIDVIALLSYDQVQYTDEGFLSLTYWTIVGAYIFKGEKNDTSTMIDAAVYDIASRKMLFRAPGISQVKGSATFVNQSEELRQDSRKGFELAADNLVENLKEELERFKLKIKEHPEEVKVIHSKEYAGGGGSGALDIGLVWLLVFFLSLRVWHRRRSSKERLHIDLV